MANTDALLAQIDAKLALLSTDVPVDYKDGEISVKNSQQVTLLLQIRESLVKNPAPDLAVMTFSNQLNEFGISF